MDYLTKLQRKIMKRKIKENIIIPMLTGITLGAIVLAIFLFKEIVFF